MGGTLEAFGLRPIRSGESAVFALWESAERPYPWGAAVFPDTTLVYETSVGLLGFAVAKVVTGEAYLSNLMVNPTFRRQGVGAEMLQKVMMWAAESGADRMVLDVDTNNLPAIKLYQKLGFDVIERRPRSYPRGEDAFIMRKEL